MNFSYAHFSDIHIGSWRDPRMRDFATLAFVKAMDACVQRNVDFILLSGDIFNTSMPPIDKLKSVTMKLKELSDKQIPVYIIAGSHDFSPSGKTMLDVLENAGLVINVVKGEITEDNKLRLRFTTDPKTGAKITGMLGKKGMLDKKYYEQLDKTNLEAEQGYKIFMFHTALSEFKPKELEQMEAHPLSLLPKGFNYYAGGHVHYIFQKDQEGYGWITYPGALFPCNFKELEEFGSGGGYFVSVNEGKTTWEHVMMPVIETCNISIDAQYKTPQQVEQELLDVLKANEVFKKIVLMRLKGKLSSGKLNDIDFGAVFSSLYERGAHFVMKNTNKVLGQEFSEVKTATQKPEEIEDAVIQEHLGQIKISVQDEKALTKQLLKILSTEKFEGETNATFETRVKDEIGKVVKEYQR